MMNRLLYQSLYLSMAAALLSSCSGTQSPIGAPGAQANVRRASGTYQVLYHFDQENGRFPDSLFDDDGTLYGTAFSGGNPGGIKGRGCGTIYTITTQGAEKLLFAFSCSGGHNPVDGFSSVHGVLYGATSRSDGVNHGTVYSISASGTETPLYTFTGRPKDGAYPSSRPINVKGTLYGTTATGGLRNPTCLRDGCGTVYSVDTSGNEKVLYKFQGSADGQDPHSLIYAKGMLYGTTYGGGNRSGTFFSLSLSGIHTVLYTFGGSSGSSGEGPVGRLLDVNGTFYGVTQSGGNGGGVVYSMSTSGAEQVLYAFGGSADGRNPSAGLINVKGTLYGTTYQGGDDSQCHSPGFIGCGTIYSVTTSGAESVLYRFTGGSDGMHPAGSLLYLKGTLYGTTAEGGLGKHKPCCGVVFALTP